MVTAPSATSSWSWMGEFLAPQLSEPTNRKWPVRLAVLAACKTRLKEDMVKCYFHRGLEVNNKMVFLCTLPSNCFCFSNITCSRGWLTWCRPRWQRWWLHGRSRSPSVSWWSSQTPLVLALWESLWTVQYTAPLCHRQWKYVLHSCFIPSMHSEILQLIS